MSTSVPMDEAPIPRWSAAPLDPDESTILAHIEQSLPARLIATLGNFTAAYAQEPVTDALERAVLHGFDFMPVRDGDAGPVVGLFRRGDALPGPTQLVRGMMQPVTDENLISAGAPLLDFVMTADTCPCRLVLDGTVIRGLITLSDIQRLPVRTVLFALFIHLELLMTDALKQTLGDDASLLDRLDTNPAKRAKKHWKKAKDAGMDRDVYAAMMFSDKITLARQTRLLGLDETQIGQELGQIETLIRHPIAHGNNFAANPSASEAGRIHSPIAEVLDRSAGHGEAAISRITQRSVI